MSAQQAAVDAVMEDSKQNTRIYVASVHPEISETDLRAVFQAFGEIVQVQLAKQHSGQGHRWVFDIIKRLIELHLFIFLHFRGFGYIEYKTASSTVSAIKGMSCFNLGGQILQVGGCVTPPEALNYVIPASGGPGLLPMTSTSM